MVEESVQSGASLGRVTIASRHLGRQTEVQFRFLGGRPEGAVLILVRIPDCLGSFSLSFFIGGDMMVLHRLAIRQSVKPG